MARPQNAVSFHADRALPGRTVGALVNSINHPNGYRFIGGTFGINISLVYLGPGLWIVLLAAIAFWMWSESGSAAHNSPILWTRTNSVLLTVALLMLPLQFVLFRCGDSTD